MTPTENLKFIYEYDNYRTYLNDYYDAAKQRLAGFSYKAFSELAGLKSPNYLKLVMTGVRDLTTDNIFSFSKAIGLSKDEERYFEALVRFNQCKSIEGQEFYKKTLKEIRGQKPKSGIKVRGIEAIKGRFFPAILNTANERKVGEEEQWAQFLGISLNDLESALDELIGHELLEKKEGLYAYQSDLILFRDKSSLNLTHKQYLKSQLEFSMEKFERDYGAHAKFIAHTFVIDEKDFDLTCEKIYSFLESLNREAEESPELNQMVQLNLQFFKFGEKRLSTFS